MVFIASVSVFLRLDICSTWKLSSLLQVHLRLDEGINFLSRAASDMSSNEQVLSDTIH